MVCNGDMTLKEAQHLIAINWIKAYKKYIDKNEYSEIDEALTTLERDAMNKEKQDKQEEQEKQEKQEDGKRQDNLRVPQVQDREYEYEETLRRESDLRQEQVREQRDETTSTGPRASGETEQRSK